MFKPDNKIPCRLSRRARARPTADGDVHATRGRAGETESPRPHGPRRHDSPPARLSGVPGRGRAISLSKRGRRRRQPPLRAATRHAQGERGGRGEGEAVASLVHRCEMRRGIYGDRCWATPGPAYKPSALSGVLLVAPHAAAVVHHLVGVKVALRAELEVCDIGHDSNTAGREVS